VIGPFRVASILLIVLSACGARAEAAVRRVWAIGDGDKVKRDDRQHAGRAKNSVWDGRTVHVFGARNEIVAFQVIVEADEQGIAKLAARLPSLTSANGDRLTYQPPAADPTDYVDRPIQLFVEHYMHVTVPTRADWIFEPGSPAAPENMLGWIPVQLVPENARAGRGGLLVAVGADANQALWIELYIGRERKAGTYRGTIAVDADGTTHDLPIELQVLDFTLPDENSMEAMLFYTSDQPELYHGRNLDGAYDRLAHRNRTQLVHGYDEQAVEASWPRFSGEAFTRANGYEGPGEAKGNTIVPRSFYGPGKGFDDRDSAWQLSDRWMTFLREKLPKAITFLYMPDEPNPTAFPRIRALADNIHSNPGPGKALPIFVTHAYTEGLDGAIDIWDSGPRGFKIDHVAAERAKGRKYWFYNGGRPWSGAIIIDAPATDARASMWAAFKHDVEVYFFWHVVHWRHNSQKQGERRQNVWADPITFDNRGQPRKPIDDQGYINGDGVLIYPGEDKLHPQEDRGVPGPVSTIQLANLRRGLQDHQYLTMAKSLGLTKEVTDAVRAIVPRVFSEAGERVSFPETGDPYEAARLTLGNAIAAKVQK
jgi:Glycoside hydrolase 123, catalytic domain